MKGSKLGEAEKATVAKGLSRFKGLGEVPRQSQHAREPAAIQDGTARQTRLTNGRLDARFSGWSYVAGECESI